MNITKAAVNQVCCHVHEKTYCNNPCSFKKQHDEVNCNSYITMQGMIADAASAWIEHRSCQQMIQIHQHRQQQDDIGY